MSQMHPNTTGQPVGSTAVSLGLTSASISRKGTEREQNCDSALDDVDHGLFAVADGVGGSAGAAKASATAILNVRRFLVPQLSSVSGDGAASAVRHAFEEANRAILKEGCAMGQHIQSTLTVAVFLDGRMYIGHAGDSRAYLLTDKEVRLLTTDHTVVEDLVRESLMSEESARQHPRRGMLSGCLGWHEEFRYHSASADVAPGQAVILCSDGISTFLSEEDILECHGGHGEACVIAEGLVSKALTNGSSDDMSVVVILPGIGCDAKRDRLRNKN